MALSSVSRILQKDIALSSVSFSAGHAHGLELNVQDPSEGHSLELSVQGIPQDMLMALSSVSRVLPQDMPMSLRSFSRTWVVVFVCLSWGLRSRRMACAAGLVPAQAMCHISQLALLGSATDGLHSLVSL